MGGRASSLLLVLGSALVASVAQAADVPSLDLRRLELPTDEAGGLYTEPAKAPGPLNWNAGIVASYANRLVVLKDESGAEVAVPVRHQLSLDYLFGVGLGDRIALGLSLPSVIYQRGSDVGDRVSGAAALPKSALGDVGLSAKAVLLPAGDLGGFALAALARVTLPTGDPTSYVSNGNATGELRVLSELSLVALTLRATVGGVDVATYEEGGDRYDVRVRLEEDQRDDLAELGLIQVRGRDGRLTDLENVASLGVASGPVQIGREDRSRKVDVFANTRPGVALGDAVKTIDSLVAQIALPPGYAGRHRGWGERMQDSFESVKFAFGLALLSLYMAMADTGRR